MEVKVIKILSQGTASLINSILLCWPTNFFSDFLIRKINSAIISYKALPLKKEVKKLVHLGLHAAALVLGIIGIYTAFKYHNESGIANLYSLHSWLGIGVIVLYGIQVNHWIYKTKLSYKCSISWRQDMIMVKFIFSLSTWHVYSMVQPMD